MCLIIFCGKYLVVSKILCIFAATYILNHIIMAKTRLRIKQILQERGMTQTELADKLGVTKITLSQNIARNNWTLGKLEEIADVLECNITDLFETAYKVKCPKCGEDIEVVLNIRGFE